MQAIGRQPRRAPGGASVHWERHRPEQTPPFRLVQRHAAITFTQAKGEASSGLPPFARDEFDAFLECGILAHGCLRLRCGDSGHDMLLAFSGKRRRFSPPCGARRMPQTAVRLVDHVSPLVPVGNWVVWVPIPLRGLVAAQPALVTPVLEMVQQVLGRHLLEGVGLTRATAALERGYVKGQSAGADSARTAVSRSRKPRMPVCPRSAQAAEMSPRIEFHQLRRCREVVSQCVARGCLSVCTDPECGQFHGPGG